MPIKNIEFKAKVEALESFEKKLLMLHPEFRGLDHQVDTYFATGDKRLKLREGNIENALISYIRANTSGAKQSEIILYKHEPDASLKQILTLHFGIQKVVDKLRKIYFIDNVKFHFDEVKGLGYFIEVEAIDTNNLLTTDTLKNQCDYYFEFFGFEKSMLVDCSYSDML